jgi:hypothetical protein
MNRAVADTAIPQTLQPYPEYILPDVVHETAFQ